jgi:hypothetical protein
VPTFYNFKFYLSFELIGFPFSPFFPNLTKGYVVDRDCVMRALYSFFITCSYFKISTYICCVFEFIGFPLSPFFFKFISIQPRGMLFMKIV